MSISFYYPGNNFAFPRIYILSFAVGITSGFILACVCLSTLIREQACTFLDAMYNMYSLCGNDGPNRRDNLNETTAMESIEIFHKLEKEFRQAEEEVAKMLTEKVRVLCMILTGPKNHETRARHVKATWGPRCNILLFMSTEEDATLPTVALNVTEGYEQLWGKSKEAFIHIYNNYLDSAEWFLKADDDTYVIVENLRYMLQAHSPDEPVYFGCRVDPDYLSGGAGYVLSRNAVQRLVENGISDPTKCKPGEIGYEDIEMGLCLAAVGVSPFAATDSLGRNKFLMVGPGDLLDPNRTFDIMTLPPIQVKNCCSNRAISFHYVLPKMMYVFEYLVYEFRVHSITSYMTDKNAPQIHILNNSRSHSPPIEEVS